jgi:hypothetical protein
MMTSTRIYGYVTEGGDVVCPGCYDPEHDGLPGEPGVWPLYDYQDDGTGLSCGHCGDWIWEPHVDEVDVLPGWTVSGRTGWAWSDVPDTVTVDYDDREFEAVMAPIDTDYGYAWVALVGARRVALFTSPDCSEYHLDGGES